MLGCSIDSPFSLPFSSDPDCTTSFWIYKTLRVSLAKRVHREMVSPYDALCSRLPGSSRSARDAPRAISQMAARWSTTRSGSMVGKGVGVGVGDEGAGMEAPLPLVAPPRLELGTLAEDTSMAGNVYGRGRRRRGGKKRREQASF